MPDDLADLRDEVAALYSGPLGDFIAQRKELLTRAKDEFPEVAARVAELRKPTRTAWVVNRLRTDEPGAFESLVESGFELRRAIGGGDPAQALQERLAAIGQALEHVERIWGEPLAPSQRQRIANSLQAISVGIDEEADGADERTVLVVEALRGRLTADLEPPGLEVLMGLQPGRPTRRTKQDALKAKAARVDSGRRTKAPSSAKASTAAARRRKARQRALRKKIDGSQKRRAQFEAEMEAARERVLELQEQLEQARARRAELRAALDAEVSQAKELESELRSLE